MWTVEQLDIMIRALSEVDFGSDEANETADRLFDAFCDVFEIEAGYLHPLDILECEA